MNAKECTEVLRKHNEWRRGGDAVQTDPQLLGVAIESAIGMIEQSKEHFDNLTGWQAACLKAEKQRDELLASLEQISTGEDVNGSILSGGECQRIAYDAIASVKGGAK